MPAAPLLGDGLVARRVRLPMREVAFLKAVLEASEGLGVIFAERGDEEVTVATTTSRVVTLDELLKDLLTELGGEVVDGPLRPTCGRVSFVAGDGTIP